MSVQKFKSTPIKNTTAIVPNYYFVIFDDYLRPKNRQIFDETTKKLLEFSRAHSKPVTLNQSIHEKWRLLVEKCTKQRVVKVKPLNNLLIDTRKVNIHQNVPKSKSGFEIYCEMASVHGLSYLVCASRWQRVFWYSILCLMLSLSISTLWNSLSLNAAYPTSLLLGTKTGIIWGNSFPAITFCNFNHISKKKINELLIKE